MIRLPRLLGTLPLVLALAALALALPPGAVAKGPVWLCKPGLATNPCTPSLATTKIDPTGAVLGPATVVKDVRPKLDCFYVYPTVSNQPAPQATLRINPEERSIALYQASRYSSLCRVYAPMYRQVTIQGLTQPKTVTATIRAQGYADVRAAWRDYLRRYNKGRGVVFISHSQGSFVLRELLAKELDPRASERRRLVSAVLLGGNVLVRKGSDTGGDFKRLRACRTEQQVGCIIAFSTYNETPPANTLFGRPREASGTIPGTTRTDVEVLCTNPAALSGGLVPLDSIYPKQPFAPKTAIGALVPLIGIPVPAVPTPWIEANGAYSGQCSSEGGVNVLRISGAPGAPVLRPLTDSTWGLHLADANIALGDLIDVVRGQGKRWAKQH